MRIPVRAGCSLAAALSVVAALLVVASPASASVLDATCTPPSSQSALYNPPLTETPQAVTLTLFTSLDPCVSATDPAIASGTVGPDKFTVPNPPGLTCSSLLGTVPVRYTIHWNTGQTSQVTGNSTVVLKAGVLTTVLTGSVTEGLFKGDTVVQNGTGVDPGIALCNLGLGTVSSVYEVFTLEITSV
ncbi:MAG: hypothetical protein ACTHLH_02310 [Solirubrobacterales bacterium]